MSKLSNAAYVAAGAANVCAARSCWATRAPRHVFFLLRALRVTAAVV